MAVIEMGGDPATTKIWQGGAEAVAQVTAFVFGGTWEADDLVRVTINGRYYQQAAGSTTISTILSSLVSNLNASKNVEIQRVTWSNTSTNLIATVDEKGVPLTITVSTTEANGGAADAQTIDGAASSTGTDSTAATGPNFANNATNWGGTLPIDGDAVIFANSSVDCLYGLDLNAVTPDGIRIDKSFTGKIGLPKYNHLGSAEGQSRYLKFGNSGDSRNTQILIGLGVGNGCRRINLDSGTGQVTIQVMDTGQPLEGEEYAFVWKGSHASNVLNVNRGSVGVATNLAETATVATTRVGATVNQGGDSNVRLGPGCTLTTVHMWGGTLRTDAAYTTLNQYGGTVIHTTGAITTANVYSGTLVYNSDVTMTTLEVARGGVFDKSQNPLATTITNVVLHAGATIKDPFDVITPTNGYDLYRCRLSDILFISPIHKTWTPSAI